MYGDVAIRSFENLVEPEPLLPLLRAVVHYLVGADCQQVRHATVTATQHYRQRHYPRERVFLEHTNGLHEVRRARSGLHDDTRRQGPVQQRSEFDGLIHTDDLQIVLLGGTRDDRRGGRATGTEVENGLVGSHGTSRGRAAPDARLP